ncbi:hypothetical protein ATO10_11080 [Actibacterium atlanticum]|uniref:EamA domain-containing protein n=1 Tax=Actibacterium atlanticum TaxID=1461693 RepID=A0A058ZKY6_9RHOB|nr:DMT family transporter [Actibacterium atlanticum]KCV81885.1 hypothetical protein ATO10_11080 [Actibacterium atlanticum]
MDNLRGIFFMVLSMAFFALEDAFIKLTAQTMPTGQVLVLLGGAGALVFAVLARSRGLRLWSPELMSGPFMIRNLCEVIGTFGMVTAIVMAPLSTVAAIQQATPLVVTAGAALFLGATVGWRRWLASAVGLCGVLLIIRPSPSGIEPGMLYAVLGMLGLAARDLAVRKVPATTPSLILAMYGFGSVVPAGLLMMLFGEGLGPVTLNNGLSLAAALVVGVTAYYALVVATRTGEIAVVTPFRYTRMLFALMTGIFMFSERPDSLTLLGAVIIIGSGLYTIWRERRR